MKAYRIAVIPGDGVGKEVVTEAVRVLDHVARLDGAISFRFVEYPWGSEYYLQHGRMMPEDALETLEGYDAILLGAVGDPQVPDHVTLWGLLLPIRQKFEQYINLRPVKLLRGAPVTLAGVPREAIDMIVIRENSEGEYSGKGDFLFPDDPGRAAALQTSVFSRRGVERVIHYAFDLGRRLNWSVTSVSKGNALNYSAVFWDQIFSEIAAEYSNVPSRSYLVDAAAMFFVKDPGRFKVVVASNLYGDILTDLGAGIAGGMGLAASANLNPTRRFPSMFEPVHGSAPDIAGKGIANPLAAIWSSALMLDHLKHPAWGSRVVDAIEATLQGNVRTPDLGGRASTVEVGDEVLLHLNRWTPGSGAPMSSSSLSTASAEEPGISR